MNRWNYTYDQGDGGQRMNPMESWIVYGQKPAPGDWDSYNRENDLPTTDDMISGMGGGGFGGWTKILRTPAGGIVKAFHNVTNQPVGELGFRSMPGLQSIRNIKVEPWARGQGYADELLEALQSLGGRLGLGSDITNSMPFWQRAAEKYPSLKNAVDYMGQW